MREAIELNLTLSAIAVEARELQAVQNTIVEKDQEIQRLKDDKVTLGNRLSMQSDQIDMLNTQMKQLQSQLYETSLPQTPARSAPVSVSATRDVRMPVNNLYFQQMLKTEQSTSPSQLSLSHSHEVIPIDDAHEARGGEESKHSSRDERAPLRRESMALLQEQQKLREREEKRKRKLVDGTM